MTTMEIERVLERIGPTKEEIVIDKNFFYCGRMKESDLTCLSLLVSREHCLFTKLSDGLYVTDLGSSNGVFVNGVQIRPKKQFFLKENDYIGIGCANIVNLNEAMYVYKVKNRIIVPDSVNNVQECSRFARKEQSKSRTSDNIQMLTKIPKTAVEHKLIVANHNLNSSNDDDMDDDIEIIEPLYNTNSIKPKEEQPNTKKEMVKCVSRTHLKNENDNVTNRIQEIAENVSADNSIVEKSNVKKVTPVILSEIIDIRNVQAPYIHKNNAEQMEIDVVPQVLHLKKEPIETDADDKIDNNVNIKQEVQNNNENNDEICIKQEPDWSCFSQIDLVEINDNDESIFPFSQLFDKTVIKEELEDQNNDVHQSSLFLDDDDENIITILDSDDENAYEINQVLPNVALRIKDEPEFQFPETTMDTTPVINDGNSISLEKVNVPYNEEIQSNIKLEYTASNINKLHDILKEQEVPLMQKELLSEVLISKDATINNKVKKKGPEIIEPHFMKPKQKTEKKEKNKSTSKSKTYSDKKLDDEKKRNFSDILKSSSVSHKINEESSSKNKKSKKDIDRLSVRSSKKIKHSGQSTSKDKKRISTKHKSCSSTSTEAHKRKTEKEKSSKSCNKTDFNSVENVLLKSETEKQIIPRNKKIIVKAKVSTKTRGDMLCDSMQTLKSKPKKSVKKSNATEAQTSKPSKKPNQLSSFVIPRRQIPSSSIPSSNSVLVDEELNNLPSTSYNKQLVSSVLSNATNHINISSNLSNNNKYKSPQSAEQTKKDNVPSELQGVKSSLSLPSLVHNLDLNQKRVSFKENIATVREFEIEEGNELRNIKHGLSIRSTRKDFINKVMDLKIEDFLARVFVWEPVWLEQQQKVKVLPPIVKQEDMHQLPSSFNCFEEYYKKMEVLLLLETWQQLLKEYECTGNRYNSSIVLPCMLVKHSVRKMQTPNGLRYSMMHINTLVSKNQLRLQNHPVYGDMIIIEYVIKQGATQKMRRAFAYIVQVQQQNSLKFLRSNEQLSKYVAHPEALLTYTVQTRVIDEHTVQFDQVARLRSILYVRSHLRLIQGLQFVPHSALQDSILNVDVNECQLDHVTKEQVYNYQLVTKEKLNEKQMEAVIKFTNTSIKLEPKIGLLIGPPGTGKSKVIANLVIQILYGDGRYVGGRPLRILVCAPSNAAIDEIVLRLLDIRGAIKEHRFKMVRIGRIESMNEEVKKISVNELAKREAQKTYFDQQHKTSENIEHKKHKLKNAINALELLLAGDPYNKVYKRDLEDYRTKYKKLSHRSPEAEAAELSKLQNSAKALILQKANVIACTLSSCYTSQMETIFGRGNSDKIATCIVDEATQCCEAETLIPLMLGVKNLILVGDPNQLPGTVMSIDAKKLGLDKSLFTRTKEALESQQKDPNKNYNDPIIMLNIQYRMLNAISHWPNQYFYGGKLIDAVSHKSTFPFQPYRVLNLDGIQDDIKFSNTSEATFVGNLINCMITSAKLSTQHKKITIGIITPYQNQKSLILSTIKERIRNVPENIKNKFITEVNTIDSFQGQERDVIIMSCVRSSGIGFLSDQQRLCVALTRAKFTLIICGNFTTFQRDNMWNDLLRDARSRGVIARLNTTAKLHEIKSHIIRLD